MSALEFSGAAAQPRGSDEPSRILGGACAELARRLNAPVGFIRGLVLVGSFLSPAVFWIYLGAVLLVPHASRRWPGAGNVVGLLRVGLLVAVVQTTFSGRLGVDDLFNQSPQVWIPQAGLCLITLLALLLSWPEGEDQDAALATSALAVLAVAALLILGMALVPGLRWERGAAVATVLVGAGLLIQTRRGNGRALVLPAVVAASGLMLLTASGARLQGGIGDLDARPVDAQAVHATYRRALGTINLDLSSLASGPRAVTVALSVGVGHINVMVPSQAVVQLDARIGRGTLMPPDAGPRIGLGIHQVKTYSPAAPPSASDLRLRVSAVVGIGTLSINRPGEGDG